MLHILAAIHRSLFLWVSRRRSVADKLFLPGPGHFGAGIRA
ncbi:hypothetical protein CLOBOL_04444 [Enterocloster bolteae ATCC BAA-613]|uniref:Uncharacterized protein n=1 Tax=Enterocloster bolteae (strain ATCC BAA-613 / DSM 15670 / CCUG 46953 / JCM 12243 / WAL 16351) TaxID=411902 RepID=A8RW03_ENTBW|nr:hypothetical protein CLOBOL_04444 [Enterocloster bolteae ATCC BAA-613]